VPHRKATNKEERQLEIDFYILVYPNKSMEKAGLSRRGAIQHLDSDRIDYFLYRRLGTRTLFV
jgi:hypothetical protein